MRARSGRIAAAAGAVLLAGAVIGGVGYTVVSVRDADRKPGAPTWEFPAADRGDEKKSEQSASGLSALFLPFGTDGYKRGPDLAEFGTDEEFSGAQATALSKESVRDLPRSTRRNVEKLIDKQRIQGMALRSYVVGRADYNTTDAITFDVTLTRLADRAAVRRMATSYNQFLNATDVFRKGPTIEGHKSARCFLTPKGEDQELGSAFCTTSVGDILVNVTVDGPGPLDATFVSKLFAAQLNRIDDPGQAV
ncbi:hypothetical protein ACIHFB_31500 [Streptomyces sp. NPDC051963]|uniref:hypothetical protein n=1 Tax=Streptomyces sp. NPDC051963 TaxID=3365678 RepID=UPI0037CD5609